MCIYLAQCRPLHAVTILSDIQLIVDDHKDEYGIRTADTLGRNFYEDDVLNTAST